MKEDTLAIRQLGDETRPNGTHVVTVEITPPAGGSDDRSGTRLVYEVRCADCADAEIERIGSGTLAQLEHHAEAIEYADGHECPHGE